MLFVPRAFVIPPSIPRLEKQTFYPCPLPAAGVTTLPPALEALPYTSGTNHIIPLDEHSWVEVGKGEVNIAIPFFLIFLITHSYISWACALYKTVLKIKTNKQESW